MPQFSLLCKDRLHTELGTNDTQVLFTGARRRAAINEGLRQFADLTECAPRQSTIAATTSAQEYNLNSSLILASQDFLRVSKDGPVFQLSDSNGLLMTLAGDEFPQVSVPFLDNAMSGWRSTVAAYPTGWYLREDGGAKYIGLDHPLYLSSGSTQTAKIVLPYVAKPSSMVSDTDVPFTFGGLTRWDLQTYHQGLVHFAAHDLEKLRKDFDASDRQLQKAMGYVKRYQDATRPKGNHVVRTAVSYFSRARRSGRDRGGLLASPWPR